MVKSDKPQSPLMVKIIERPFSTVGIESLYLDGQI